MLAPLNPYAAIVGISRGLKSSLQRRANCSVIEI